MKVCVFTGPSLPPEAARRIWAGPVYLPPATQGDVYRMACRKLWGIGIIDGLFERVPAVWHKEILWAMSQGIHVYGSSAMGALRAAELAAFGMVGVGAIFKEYAQARIEDDDEVIRVFGGAARNYKAGSEAMINIRYTLAKAVRERILSAKTAASVMKIGKALFYPHRTYQRIVEEGHRCALPPRELQRFREWVAMQHIDQQREDAIALLTRMRKDLRDHPGRKRANFSLEKTKYWDRVARGSK